jgi:c-di-AMP phosphodiesterase-like protein
MRQFDASQIKDGSGFIDYDPKEFEKEMNRLWQEMKDKNEGKEVLVDGYVL